MKRICALFLLILTLAVLAANGHADIDPFDGMEQGVILVNGVNYKFPIIPEAGKGFAVSKTDLYYLKKAFDGDPTAREVILGGEKERIFYIGRERPRWLVIGIDSEK